MQLMLKYKPIVSSIAWLAKYQAPISQFGEAAWPNLHEVEHMMPLTHLPLDKMAAISQMRISDAF